MACSVLSSSRMRAVCVAAVLLCPLVAHGDDAQVRRLRDIGAMARFDLSDGTVPILTTKRVFWKTAVKEMLWFLTGQTNIQPLIRANVRIWTDWPLAAYRRETGEAISQSDFEKRIAEDDAFAARWGELGPVYGKQWRRWLGADGREHAPRHDPRIRKEIADERIARDGEEIRGAEELQPGAGRGAG